jgi:hypothetical protein
MVLVDVVSDSSMTLAAGMDGGSGAGTPFAVITIILAGLLFAREISATTRLGTPRITKVLTIAIVPLLVLFVINLALVFF